MVPKRRFQTTIRGETVQKTEHFISTVAEALDKRNHCSTRGIENKAPFNSEYWLCHVNSVYSGTGLKYPARKSHVNCTQKILTFTYLRLRKSFWNCLFLTLTTIFLANVCKLYKNYNTTFETLLPVFIKIFSFRRSARFCHFLALLLPHPCLWLRTPVIRTLIHKCHTLFLTRHSTGCEMSRFLHQGSSLVLILCVRCS